MPFWTYILHCNAGVFYTGHTDDLERRVSDHQAGRFPGFIRNYLPVELAWSQEFVTRDEAKAAERQIKGWSRRKKLALIRGDWVEMGRLAKTKSSPSTGSGQADVDISIAVLSGMKAHARAAHPRECCGILLGRAGRILEARATANVHPASETHFEIDPQALIDAHRAARNGGLQVLGYYHSHPSGPPHPSATDRAMAAGDRRIWAIIAGTEVMFWQDCAGGFEALSYSLADG